MVTTDAFSRITGEHQQSAFDEELNRSPEAETPRRSSNHERGN